MIVPSWKTRPAVTIPTHRAAARRADRHGIYHIDLVIEQLPKYNGSPTIPRRIDSRPGPSRSAFGVRSKEHRAIGSRRDPEGGIPDLSLTPKDRMVGCDRTFRGDSPADARIPPRELFVNRK